MGTPPTDRPGAPGLLARALAWLGRGRRVQRVHPRTRRGPLSHVVVLDGTMSSLETGHETNAGLAWGLLRDMPASAGLSLYYEPGIQFTSWRQVRDVIEGRGLNHQIRRAYGWLASRYRPGDRIYLLGYSRGAYAVRSLAGVIDRVGLLRHDAATQRNVELAYRHYRVHPGSDAAWTFRERFCHADSPIHMIGCWDTVKALGLRAPIIWRWSQMMHRFHDHALGSATRSGYHALALDETRAAYAPVLWQTGPGWIGRCEQVWFRGTHADIGGQVGTRPRGLANIPLVWMLERAEAEGLALPPGWPARFPCDPRDRSVGTFGGWGRFCLVRSARVVGRDPSERIHPSAAPREAPGRLARLRHRRTP